MAATLPATALLIDRLCEAAERDPGGSFEPGLSFSRAFAESGAVASWLIAQGYGPDGRSLSLASADSVVRLGALRAGVLLKLGGVGDDVPVGAMKACSVDAAVAERRLHITADTPALERAGAVVRQGDLAQGDLRSAIDPD